MSIHSERQNLLQNRSGNAPLSVHTRSGDSEDGAELFDLMPAVEQSALDIVSERDQRAERIKFLTAYFELLKTHLNKWQFEFCKELYRGGRSEVYVFKKLGLQRSKFKREIVSTLAEHNDEVQALVDNSDWENAELFSRTFLANPDALAERRTKNRFVDELEPVGAKGFGNLLEAKLKRAYRRGYAAGHEAKKRDFPILRKARVKRDIEALRSAITCFFNVRTITGCLEAVGVEIDERFERFIACYSVLGNVLLESLNRIENKLF